MCRITGHAFCSIRRRYSKLWMCLYLSTENSRREHYKRKSAPHQCDHFDFELMYMLRHVLCMIKILQHEKIVRVSRQRRRKSHKLDKTYLIAARMLETSMAHRRALSKLPSNTLYQMTSKRKENSVQVYA